MNLAPSIQLIFNHVYEGMSDQEFYDNEVELALLAEPLGFSAIWCVEHHFDREYSMCPDNFTLLAYLAGRTETIELKTAAVILPWHSQPLRVAENISLLDILSKGRLSIGFGRGLSRREYEDMGVDMEQSRARWEEAADMIAGALKTGYAEYDGAHYQQPRAQIAPFSNRALTGRLTEIAMSPESTKMAAELGLAMATFVQKPIEGHKPLLDLYRDTYVSTHGTAAPPPTISDAIYCSADPDEAREMHYRHARRYFAELMRHYEFAGTHFTGTKGYESYAEGAAMLREAGMEAAADSYAEANLYGTPEQILQRFEDRLNLIGDFHLNAFFTYGGVPHDKAEAGMRLFAKEVIPEIVRMREKCRPAA